MWTYQQSSGALFRDGLRIATGYSGHGAGRNNPAMEAVPCVGPIPRGRYRIGTAMANYPPHGPVVMRLTPDGHDCHGRGGFLIHGDNAAHDASEGCIILARPTREAIAKSGDPNLEVI